MNSLFPVKKALLKRRRVTLRVLWSFHGGGSAFSRYGTCGVYFSEAPLHGAYFMKFLLLNPIAILSVALLLHYNSNNSPTHSNSAGQFQLKYLIDIFIY